MKLHYSNNIFEMFIRFSHISKGLCKTFPATVSNVCVLIFFYEFAGLFRGRVTDLNKILIW